MKELTVAIEDLLPEPVKVALQSELSISNDLEREVRRSSAQYGYYAVLAVKAESKLRRGKLSFDMWQSQIEEELGQDKTFKRVKDLTRLVMRHPSYKAWKLKLDKYEEDMDLLKAIAKSFEHKISLVQTSCADRRKESR